VRCWLTEGQERDEKRQPILWTERPTGAVMGGWFTLASKCKLSSFVHLLLCVFRLLFTDRTLFGPKILDLIWAISSQADPRIGHNICKMHNLIVRVLNACARVVVGLEERCPVCSWTVISHSGREYVFVGEFISWFTCMQNMGAWRMLGDYSMRIHLYRVTWNATQNC